MGFRSNTWATVWEVRPKSDTKTSMKISISRKNPNTGEYQTDFSGFVDAVGTACAKKAACLHEKDRIKIGDVDVSNRYDKEKNTTYTYFKVFGFEVAPDSKQQSSSEVGDGEVEVEDDDLPF